MRLIRNEQDDDERTSTGVRIRADLGARQDAAPPRRRIQLMPADPLGCSIQAVEYAVRRSNRIRIGYNAATAANVEVSLLAAT